MVVIGGTVVVFRAAAVFWVVCGLGVGVASYLLYDGVPVDYLIPTYDRTLSREPSYRTELPMRAAPVFPWREEKIRNHTLLSASTMLVQ